jgi:hypothetical protein
MESSAAAAAGLRWEVAAAARAAGEREASHRRIAARGDEEEEAGGLGFAAAWYRERCAVRASMSSRMVRGEAEADAMVERPRRWLVGNGEEWQLWWAWSLVPVGSGLGTRRRNLYN